MVPSKLEFFLLYLIFERDVCNILDQHIKYVSPLIKYMRRVWII